MQSFYKKGVYHNLEDLYHQINSRYFENRVEATIAWGKYGKTTARKRSIRLGSYCMRRKKITIHPALDQACVPCICIERIVHHEMLHQLFPAKRTLFGRRSIHHAEFRRNERLFIGADRADQWIQENLRHLLS
ncbi:MAG: hypothetical protein I8H75_00510 [Myxococcaceae bacterium]|nr:hypothetical protein [Myxococcaceae bacterium]MBH2005825.1 hypothetical protein [Myxococcaceae bacterium]